MRIEHAGKGVAHRSGVSVALVALTGIALAGCASDFFTGRSARARTHRHAPRTECDPSSADPACANDQRREPEVAAAAATLVEPAPVPRVMQALGASDPEPLDFDGWKGFGIGSCAYLAPKHDVVHADGSVDVVFHFHAGQMAERDIRKTALRGVFVSCGYGIGGGPYASAFADPNRFDVMIRALTATIGRATGRDGVHLGRLALASWSAGFAALTKILAVPRWYDATDVVVLNDSLHAPYKNDRGPDVDVRSIGVFVKFARDAAAGNKLMVMTHSSIVPPDYASSTEAAAALLDAINAGESPSNVVAGQAGGSTPVANLTGAPVANAPSAATTSSADAELDATYGMVAVANGAGRPMKTTRRVDRGNLHVRGFGGGGPTDHFDHLHLIGRVVNTWLVPRWSDEELVYTRGGEQR